MTRIEFTKAEQDLLYENYRKHPHPIVRQKMLCLYLKSLDNSHGSICEICRISRTTLNEYFNQYKTGGIERLKELKYPKRSSALDKDKDKIKDDFNNSPPHTINEAMSRIESLTGTKLSPSAVRDWMVKNGLKYIKAGVVPGKTNQCPEQKAQEREIFVQQKLEPCLKEARAGKRAVFFVDAAHFVYGNFVHYLWCFARVFLPSANGRKRFNVLGAIDAVTKQIITITNTAYINSQSVVELMLKLKKMYGDIDITLVLDNARYQRCKFVQEQAQELGIELLFLPSYSPQLNLIERFWKFVKKKCLYGKFYENFELFKNSIDDFIQKAPSEFKDELETLISWKFQTFKNVQFLTV